MDALEAEVNRVVSGSAAAPVAAAPAEHVDISVVMPCLNEEGSVGLCVARAWQGISKTGLRGEVVVCDNCSSDNSAAVAEAAGARVVHESKRGYGRAYQRAIEAARGRIIVMADSDSTYDVAQLDELIKPFADGYEYVLGSRFSGQILPGAMPWTHQYIGNPVLTATLNRLFSLRSSDAHSGMRAFTREAYERMRLRATGMEFASELVINAARAGLRFTEVPITYYPRVGSSKLNPVRDGWRHLRFMLQLSPKHLFFMPGLVVLFLGFVGQIALLPGPLPLGFHAFDMHFSALFALLSIVGYQSVLFALYTDVYARKRSVPHAASILLRWIERYFTLERGLLAGSAMFAVGFAVDVYVLIEWLARSLGPLNEMRPALLAMTLMVLGLQTIFGSFFLSILQSEYFTPPAAPEADSDRV